MSSRIRKVAVTGGPCSGKTTFLERATRTARAAGWDVYPIEEPATKLIKDGLPIKEALRTGNIPLIYACERRITRWCLDVRHQTLRHIRVNGRGKKAVIIYDRGIPDNFAYMPEGPEGEEMYLNILRETSHQPQEILAMYDAVIKLTTAAIGAPRFYSLSNNEARTEELAEAIRLDRRIDIAYAAHPMKFVIDNSTDFEKKMERALAAFTHVLNS